MTFHERFQSLSGGCRGPAQNPSEKNCRVANTDGQARASSLRHLQNLPFDTGLHVSPVIKHRRPWSLADQTQRHTFLCQYEVQALRTPQIYRLDVSSATPAFVSRIRTCLPLDSQYCLHPSTRAPMPGVRIWLSTIRIAHASPKGRRSVARVQQRSMRHILVFSLDDYCSAYGP